MVGANLAVVHADGSTSTLHVGGQDFGNKYLSGTRFEVVLRGRSRVVTIWKAPTEE